MPTLPNSEPDRIGGLGVPDHQRWTVLLGIVCVVVTIPTLWIGRDRDAVWR